MPEKASPRLAFYILLSCKMPFGPSSLRSNVQNRSRRFFTFCCPAKCPLGQLKLLKITPGDFLFAAIHGAHPLGHRLFVPMFKIAPGDFLYFAG